MILPPLRAASPPLFYAAIALPRLRCFSRLLPRRCIVVAARRLYAMLRFRQLPYALTLAATRRCHYAAALIRRATLLTLMRYCWRFFFYAMIRADVSLSAIIAIIFR